MMKVANLFPFLAHSLLISTCPTARAEFKVRCVGLEWNLSVVIVTTGGTAVTVYLGGHVTCQFWTVPGGDRVRHVPKREGCQTDRHRGGSPVVRRSVDLNNRTYRSIAGMSRRGRCSSWTHLNPLGCTGSSLCC